MNLHFLGFFPSGMIIFLMSFIQDVKLIFRSVCGIIKAFISQGKIMEKKKFQKITDFIFIYLIVYFIIYVAANLFLRSGAASETIYFLWRFLNYLNYFNYILMIILLYFIKNKKNIESVEAGQEKKPGKTSKPVNEQWQDLNKKIFKASIWTIVVLLCLSAFIGINVLLGSMNNGFSYDSLKPFLTSLMIDFYVLMSMAVFSLRNKKGGFFTTISWVGMAINAFGLVWSMLQVWEAFGYSKDWTAQLFFIIMVVSFGIAHTSLILLIKPKATLITALKAVTIVFIFINVLYLIMLIVDKFENHDSFILLAIISILVLLGSIVTPILNKLSMDKPE